MAATDPHQRSGGGSAVRRWVGPGATRAARAPAVAVSAGWALRSRSLRGLVTMVGSWAHAAGSRAPSTGSSLGAAARSS